MRLEVFCEDRIGLTRELLDLLVLRSLDLRGIEIDPVGRIYLSFSSLDFDAFSSLMAEIRRISGVTDVRTIAWMPSEREHRALSALLEALPEAVLSLDMKSKVELANPASCALFGQSEDKLRNLNASSLVAGFNFLRWLELWKDVTEEVLGARVAAGFQEKADRIAESLQLGVQFHRERGRPASSLLTP